MSQVPIDRRRLVVTTDVRGADIEVSVRDSGTGLPADLDGKLFTPFVTTKSHGVGIGLAIAETIVAAHGGTIGGSNNPDGGGATFSFTLRRSDTREAVGA
jgi:two-component system sensor kinase FixL